MKRQTENLILLFGLGAAAAALAFEAAAASTDRPRPGRALDAARAAGLGPRPILVGGPPPPQNRLATIPEWERNAPGAPSDLSVTPTGRRVLFDPRAVSPDARVLLDRKGNAPPVRYVKADPRPTMGHRPYWAWPAWPFGWDSAFDETVPEYAS